MIANSFVRWYDFLVNIFFRNFFKLGVEEEEDNCELCCLRGLRCCWRKDDNEEEFGAYTCLGAVNANN